MSLHYSWVWCILQSQNCPLVLLFNLSARLHAWLSPRIIIVHSLFCSLIITFFFPPIFLVWQLDSSTLPNLNSLILDEIFCDLFLLVVMPFISTGILAGISSDWVCISDNTSYVWIVRMSWSLEYAEHFFALFECLSFHFLRFYKYFVYHFQWGNMYHLIYSVHPGVPWW